MKFVVGIYMEVNFSVVVVRPRERIVIFLMLKVYIFIITQKIEERFPL